jgi:hypothetical protein
MMKFEFQYDKGRPHVTIEIDDPDATCQEVVEQFKLFLIACGYQPASIRESFLQECGE